MNSKHAIKRSKVSRSGVAAAFTIVELLIVIVVIAILAAITIVAYNGINERAKASAASSTTSQAAKKIMSYAVINAEQYPDTLASAGLTDGNGTTYQYRVDNNAAPKTFCITATTNGVSYYASNVNNTPTAGVCSGHVTSTQLLVTNLVHNPTFNASAPNTWTTASAAGSVGTNAPASPDGPSGVTTEYLRRSTTAAPTASPLQIKAQTASGTGFPVDANSTYTASAYMRSSCTHSSGFRLDVTRVGHATPSVTGALGANTANTWLRRSNTFTTDASTTAVEIRFSFSGGTSCPANSTYDVTGVMLTKSSDVKTYADGDKPGWAWLGTQYNSPSSGPEL